jgi:hypothetical protein
MDIFNEITTTCMHKKKDIIALGGGDTHHSPPQWIEPKPSAGGVAHGVWMAPVRLVWVPPRHRRW